MSIGVGVYLASYLQNRSERLTHKMESPMTRPGSEAEFQKLLNSMEGSNDIPLSEWKMVFDALSEPSNRAELPHLSNVFEANRKKSDSDRGAGSGKRALMNGMKSERLFMMSKIQPSLTAELPSRISSDTMNPVFDEFGNLVEKEDWTEVFGQAQESAEFMSYASDNFESRASKHKKSKIPTAGNNALVKGQYDAYKFFSLSNVEKMMNNNYRPQEAVRILDLAL